MTAAQPRSSAPPNSDGDVIIQPARFQPPPRKRGRSGSSISLRTLAAAASLVLAAVALWYLFSARLVEIEVQPAEASVAIEGTLAPHWAHRYLLRRGTYPVSVSAPGYRPVQQELVVGDASRQRFEFELRPLPGHLTIVSAPVADATIYVDDESVGVTPGTLRNLEAGSHRIRLEHERYLPFEQAVEIQGKDIEQTLEATLEPAWADVTLSSAPAGAEVFVDEEKVGQTPLTTPILQGKRALRVKLSGYKDWERELQVVAGQAQAFEDIVLDKADAIITIVTAPAGANVTVDGRFKGKSPLEVAVSPNQAHSVALFKEGYAATTREVTVGSGERRRVNVDLSADLAPVEFVVTPPDAELVIDGRARGAANQRLTLPARPHEIEVRKAGFVSYKTTLTPRKGVEQRVEVSLKTVQQVQRESVKPLATNVVGQQMKLFRGGTVTLGASRREAGRRANEVIKQVKLTRPFYMSLHEITNKQYRQFQAAHTSKHVQGRSLNGDDQPVVNVTWEEAAMFCNWLSQRESLPLFYQISQGKVTGFNAAATGYRLPTEAEWAWAARVLPGGEQLKFPWGDAFPPKGKAGNFADQSAADLVARIIPNYTDGFAVSTKVGSFGANANGLYDMGGNVAEWVHDFYDISTSASGTVLTDPVGPTSGEFHAIRGSSWAHGSVTELRLSYRDYGNKRRDDVGFRVARYAE